MEQDFIPDDGDGIIEATNDGVREQLATNPMFRLQVILNYLDLHRLYQNEITRDSQFDLISSTRKKIRSKQ